jgi:hypothetical protein
MADQVETKRCTGCGEELPIDDFGVKLPASGKRQARCRTCMRAYQREWYAAHREDVTARVRKAKRERHRKNDAIIKAAKDQPCTDCGQRYAAEEMDFDHVRGVKSFNIGNARYDRSVEQLLNEIDKCEVVCAVCHRLRTVERLK